MFINLNNPEIGSDVDANLSSLLQKLQRKVELERELNEVQEGIDTFANRSFRTLKPKLPKTNERIRELKLVILDKEGNAHEITLEEYYKDENDSDPSFAVHFNSHLTI